MQQGHTKRKREIHKEWQRGGEEEEEEQQRQQRRKQKEVREIEKHKAQQAVGTICIGCSVMCSDVCHTYEEIIKCIFVVVAVTYLFRKSD